MTTGELIVVGFIVLAFLPLVLGIAVFFLFGAVDTIISSWRALFKLFRTLR